MKNIKIGGFKSKHIAKTHSENKLKDKNLELIGFGHNDIDNYFYIVGRKVNEN